MSFSILGFRIHFKNIAPSLSQKEFQLRPWWTHKFSLYSNCLIQLLHELRDYTVRIHQSDLENLRFEALGITRSNLYRQKICAIELIWYLLDHVIKKLAHRRKSFKWSEHFLSANYLLLFCPSICLFIFLHSWLNVSKMMMWIRLVHGLHRMDSCNNHEQFYAPGFWKVP